MPVQLDFKDLLAQMVAAAKATIGKEWPEAKEIAESSLEKLAKNIVNIQKMKLSGKIDEDDAKSMLKIQRNALETVLLTEKVIVKKGVENFINAVLSAVSNTVNTAIGWTIL